MLTKNLFRKPKNELEGYDKLLKVPSPSIPDEMCVVCPDCKRMILSDELMDSTYVCPKCGRHFRLGARQRIGLLTDEGSFEEMDADMTSQNLLDFPEYDNKLKHARLDSNEKDGVLTGLCSIMGAKCAIFVMEPYFMIGSMGTVVGEKITRLFEKATELGLPVIGFTVSGGARVQEGVLSLMQMAKTSAAVKRHSDAGNLYLAVLTDPTTGGVAASFAMEADIILAEPKALIGFAGPRVIEQTIRQKLPEGFQRAEFQLEKGFVDMIADRRQHRTILHELIHMHDREVRG
jgi:acetyl-CoA carboxylase carboxyl transferase beta subunit